jgi:predicted GNAT superfamily acetyltransferase
VTKSMFEWEANNKLFFIRDVERDSEYHDVEVIQKEAWGFNDLDTVPAATLMASQHAGGIVLGAFDRERMIGFAYGFPAFENGRASIHSHMLGVKTDYRNCHAGFYLKLAQRECALEKGLDEITWTFDPLQSLNAHLNFTKLGVISNRYIVNFYGEATSSPLHTGFGTDRLWVRWLLQSERVKRRIELVTSRVSTRLEPNSVEANALIESALVCSENSRPRLLDFAEVLSGNRSSIEIPNDINNLKARSPELGPAWREATRAAFLAALNAGFVVQAFERIDSENGPRWFYSLTKYGDLS